MDTHERQDRSNPEDQPFIAYVEAMNAAMLELSGIDTRGQGDSCWLNNGKVEQVDNTGAGHLVRHPIRHARCPETR